MNGLTQLLVLIVAVLWAAFSTYQWVATDARTDTLVAEAIAAEQAKAQNAAAEQAEKAKAEAALKTEEIKIVYKTVKDTVYKNRVVSQCPGNFPSELRMGLANATAEANGVMLTAPH